MGSLPEGKVKVRLEHDGTVLEVDEDDVEKVGGVNKYVTLLMQKPRNLFNYSHLSVRQILYHMIEWRISPLFCTSTSPASFTPFVSAMVETSFTPTLGQIFW